MTDDDFYAPDQEPAPEIICPRDILSQAECRALSAVTEITSQQAHAWGLGEEDDAAAPSQT